MAELKETKFKTQHGRVIYEFGDEKVSEKSITIKMDNGSWVNVPTIHNGKIYTEFQIKDMLDNFVIMPTSRHASKKDAESAAKTRSDDIIQIPAKAYDISWRNPENTHLFDDSGNRTNKLADGSDMSNAQKFAAYQTYPKEKAAVEEGWNESIMNPDNLEEVQSQGYSQAELDEFENIRLKELAAMTKEANMTSRHPEGKGYWANIFDLDRLNKKFRLPLDPDAQSIRDATGYPEEKRRPFPSSSPAVGSGISTLRGLELAESRFNQDSSNAQYAQFGTPAKGSGIPTLRGEALAESRFNEDADAMQPYQREYKSSKIKGSGIPVLRGEEKAEQYSTDSNKGFFKYKPHMSPDQKMNDNRSLKGLTPKYGEMPGFKKAKDGNYWSADETSPFWQTDAGYEKAMQTWGEKPGWVKPNYRPKKQELDIDAIKKWFKPNK